MRATNQPLQIILCDDNFCLSWTAFVFVFLCVSISTAHFSSSMDTAVMLSLQIQWNQQYARI